MPDHYWLTVDPNGPNPRVSLWSGDAPPVLYDWTNLVGVKIRTTWEPEPGIGPDRRSQGAILRLRAQKESER